MFRARCIFHPWHSGRHVNSPKATLGALAKSNPSEGAENAWHALEGPSVLQRLNAGPGGLSGEEAARRRQVHGPNRLPQGKRRGPLLRFLLQFQIDMEGSGYAPEGAFQGAGEIIDPAADPVLAARSQCKQ